MKFPAKSGGDDFKVAPAGNHVAICNAIVDLGWQPGRGMYPQPKHEVYVRFELPDEQISYQKDGQDVQGPMSIGRRFTASMSQKANLRKFIESWFGKSFPSDEVASDFDLELLLGRKCLLNITHNEKGDKTYANIANATPLPKSMADNAAEAANPLISFDLSSWNNEAFQKLPEWLQKTINERLDDPGEQSSQEPRETVSADEFDDDIPF